MTNVISRAILQNYHPMSSRNAKIFFMTHKYIDTKLITIASHKKILYIEFEYNHITILNDIVLSLELKKSFFFCFVPSSIGNDIFIMYYFCLDKSFLEICMDSTSSLRSSRSDRYSPCLRFFFSASKIIHET